MAEIGRFALGSMSAMVTKFFAHVGDIPGMVVGQEYSKKDMEKLLNIDSYGITFQNYKYDDGKGDYAERTFIWNSSAFKIGDEVRFVIEQDENGNIVRKIKNYYIEPLKINDRFEDFDFDTNNIVFQAFIKYLKLMIDPSDIGRKVPIDVIGGPQTIGNSDYTIQDYFNDVQNEQKFKVGYSLLPDLKLWPETNELLQQLWDHNITRFIDAQGRPIFYGTTEEDSAVDILKIYKLELTKAIYSALAELFPFLPSSDIPETVLDHSDNGFVYIGHTGDDNIITAISKSVDIYGGAGDDSIYIYSASDGGDVRGGEGNDNIILLFSSSVVADAGKGDDWVTAFGGTGVITIGGLGSDFIFNTSYYGQLYGDTVDGVGASKAGQADSDVFWYWPSTFIMDAQPNDILQFFGLPLTGGTNTFFVSVRSPSLFDSRYLPEITSLIP